MGDRGNIVIRNQGSDIFLYTHWQGSALGSIAHEALARKERWDHPVYLARIVFQAMVGPDTSPIGFGIGTAPPDNDHAFLVLDCASQRVLQCPMVCDKVGPPTQSWSFADFIAAPPITDWP